MSKSQRTPLVEAAAGFDEELATYARLGELFLKTPLTSLRHLERANQTLQELADSEQRLAACGQRLSQALGEARMRQEGLSEQIVAYAPALRARNEQLQALTARMAQLGSDVAAINARTSTRDAGDVSAAVLALSQRAEELAGAARGVEFEELAAQAHALFQRLEAIAQKLVSSRA